MVSKIEGLEAPANLKQIQSCCVLVEQAFRPALRAHYLPRGFSPWARAEATESIWVRLDAALKRRSTQTAQGYSNCGTALAAFLQKHVINHLPHEVAAEASGACRQ